MKLTKPGQLRSFAAYPQCWADNGRVAERIRPGDPAGRITVAEPTVGAAVGGQYLRGPMLGAVQFVVELLDFLLNWRSYMCIVLALCVAYVISLVFPDLTGGTLYLSAAVVGAIVGFVWDWRRG